MAGKRPCCGCQLVQFFFITPQVSGSTLPDDVLLLIFKLLDRQTLVEGVRPVCSQWRRVSRHRSLWKNNIFIFMGIRSKPELLYMRASSYLKYLSVSLAPKDSEWNQRNLVEYDWEGQVESLTISLHSDRYDSSPRLPLLPRDYSLCVEVFRKFSQGVSSLRISTDSKTGFPKEDVRILLDLMGKAPRLKELSLQCRVVRSYDGPFELGDLALQKLDVTGYDETSSTVIVALVSASRSSLQRFQWCPDSNAVGVGYSSVMQELALCSVLSRVSLPCFHDFSPIAGSKTMRTMELWFPRISLSNVEPAPIDYTATCGYIRCLAVGSVTELEIKWPSCTTTESALLLDAFHVLTQLKSLTITASGVIFNNDITNHIISMLRHLVNLEELDLGRMFGSSPEDVGVITPDILPRLRRLVLRDLYPGGPDPALDDLLAQRAGLCIVGPRHYEAKWKGVVCHCRACRRSRRGEEDHWW